MREIPKVLILLSVLSLAAGIIVKLIGFDFSQLGIGAIYPVKPQSFLNFSNTILLLSIALLLTNKKNDLLFLFHVF